MSWNAYAKGLDGSSCLHVDFYCFNRDKLRENPMATKRTILQIEATPDVRERIDGICVRRGMTQVSVMSRMVNWLCTQDDYVQTSVLQATPDDVSHAIATVLLKKLSKAARNPPQ